MPEVPCLVCPHVLTDARPVRVMIHHSDGTWQAVCGEWDHSEQNEDFKVVGINHLFDRQTDLSPLRTLAPEQIAELIDGRWVVSIFAEDELD